MLYSPWAVLRHCVRRLVTTINHLVVDAHKLCQVSEISSNRGVLFSLYKIMENTFLKVRKTKISDLQVTNKQFFGVFLIIVWIFSHQMKFLFGISSIVSFNH